MIHRHNFPISDIVVGDRTRQEFRNLDSLARSISERGLLSPINLRLAGDGSTKELVCGGRRLAAVKSLGWTTIDVLIIEDDLDELDVLLAEGDENTEREPFTPAEAVRHRQRIREVESAAAKVRQQQSGRDSAVKRSDDGSSKLDEPSGSPLDEVGMEVDAAAPLGIKYKERDHKAESERTTRHRTAKATGYSATSLDKAEEVVEAAESEDTPEPVREAATRAATNLAKPGAKVDREYKAYREEVARNNPDVRAANYRKALTQALARAGDLAAYDPERVVEVADDSLIRTIDDTCEQLAKWGASVKRQRSGGLRVVNGGQQ